MVLLYAAFPSDSQPGYAEAKTPLEATSDSSLLAFSINVSANTHKAFRCWFFIFMLSFVAKNVSLAFPANQI